MTRNREYKSQIESDSESVLCQAVSAQPVDALEQHQIGQTRPHEFLQSPLDHAMPHRMPALDLEAGTGLNSRPTIGLLQGIQVHHAAKDWAGFEPRTKN
jgi:hypothetical protein